MAEEIPKKTVMVLLVLVILVSILSTIVVLTAVNEGEGAKKISKEAGVESAAQNEKTTTATVSLTIEEPKRE